MWPFRRNRPPSAAEVARRLVVLKYVAGYALTTPPREALAQAAQGWDETERARFAAKAQALRDEYWQRVRELGLWEALSPQERELAGTTMLTMTPQQRLAAAWRVEAAHVLMWALGLLDNLLPYDQAANPDLLKRVPGRDVAAFVKSARLRPAKTIAAERDVAELWHWRSRTRELIESGRPLEPDENMRAAGIRSFDDIVRLTARHCREEGRIATVDEDLAARGKAYRDLTADEWAEVRSVAIERHFALNWLCGYAPRNRWDETPTDT